MTIFVSEKMKIYPFGELRPYDKSRHMLICARLNLVKGCLNWVYVLLCMLPGTHHQKDLYLLHGAETHPAKP